jgi:hypothetical protein
VEHWVMRLVARLAAPLLVQSLEMLAKARQWAL